MCLLMVFVCNFLVFHFSHLFICFYFFTFLLFMFSTIMDVSNEPRQEDVDEEEPSPPDVC